MIYSNRAFWKLGYIVFASSETFKLQSYNIFKFWEILSFETLFNSNFWHLDKIVIGILLSSVVQK